jgi:GRASP55/65 PDZ-like domain
VVWNIKSQTARLVDIVPSDTWGGAGLLGVTIRIDNYAGAEDRLVRVLSIESHKSPAAIAGLIPEKDYLLGTTHQTLDSVDRLAEVLRQHEDEVVELYVYNTDDDMVRVVALLPTSSWEGSRGGLLGAEVGTGYLHRLPHTSRFTSGSSIERKVRYVDVGQSGDTTTNGTEERATESEKRTKILEMEPQLEMEPAEDEESDSHPMIAPKVPTDAPRSSSIPVAQQQSNVNAVPALIFTPIAQESSPSNGGSQSYGGANSPLPPPRQTTGTPSPKVGISPRNSITAVRYPPIPYLQTAAYPSPMAHRANPVSVFSQPPPIQPPSGGSISTSSHGQPNFNVAPAAIVPTHSYNSTNHGALPFMSLPPPPAPQVSLTSQRH